MKTSAECIKAILSLIKSKKPQTSPSVDEPCEECPLKEAEKVNMSKNPKINKDSFSVPSGQITFDAEGNDNENSPYFSRKVHWPGTDKSGVTLGRGYDMGHRTVEEVKSDLIKAGLNEDRAKAFATGAGKRGKEAKDFVAKNSKQLGHITPDEQKALFINTFSKYEIRAKNSYNYHQKSFTGEKPTDWEKLDKPVRDILIDFNYQGYGKTEPGYGRPMHKGMNNDPKELIDYINSVEELKNYDRGRNRVRYLKNAYGVEPS